MGKYDGNQEWFLGLDIGTNSVGWAVTDPQYNILKFKGNAMWGIYLFDEAKTAAERRVNRSARRRLARRKQRINFLQEFFAKEIAKQDERFYLRLRESGLWADDRTTDVNLFVGGELTDKEYNKKYPTIHHLIVDLMENKEYHDPRLVYMACSYILSHRGHFLFDVSDVDKVNDFHAIYQELSNWFDACDISLPWKCTEEEFSSILNQKVSLTKKIELFKNIVFDGKFPANSDDDDVLDRLSTKAFIEMLCGRKTKISDLFIRDDYKLLEKDSITVSSAEYEDDIEQASGTITDYEYDLLLIIKKMYDWSLLNDILSGETYISKAKTKVYEQHRKDLKTLKYFIKKYASNKYSDMFRKVGKEANYSSYSYNTKNLGKEVAVPSDFKMCGIEEFSKYAEGILKSVSDSIEEDDKQSYEEMMNRLALRSFCPKQVTGDNRVIPYQLYYQELKLILDNASEYLPFLNEGNESKTVKDKILTMMKFRIPYYVGPLNPHSKFSWIVKKNGKITPWNFDDMVDKDACEEIFIKRMTGKCTYIAGEDVLPKYSLLYSKYVVLNEINNLKINGTKISVDTKQSIFDDLFRKKRRVTKKDLEEYLLAKGVMQKEDSLQGIDVKINSELQSYHDFKSFIENGKLTERQVEEIIYRITTTTDRRRLYNWIKTNYELTDDEIKRISKLKYNDFGRLSRRLLTEVYDLDISTGEIRREENIIEMLWNTNNNLMMLLSDEYGYSNCIKSINDEYYGSNPQTLDDRLADMYIPNSVKRPILRVMDIVNELRGIMKCDPNKVFVEMARGASEEQKNKRTKSRRDQIKEMYSNYNNSDEYREDIGRLLSELESKTDGELRSEKLFLYFTQLGRCMYSGQPIEINDLGNSKLYDVDHIWPQSKIKDDSLDNKVLVLTRYNGIKGDNYPICEEWRIKQYGFWHSLRDRNLISDKKFDRLTRKTRFTDEELASFINRQLVETRQTTKAVATLLNEKLPSSKIVYVKAGLVSNFRQLYKDTHYTLKCREVNDLHHAKDAYLNIVMGNVYSVRFTDNPLNFIRSGEQYTLNLNKILERDVVRGKETAWLVKDDVWFNRVINTIHKNNIRFVRYSYCQKGALFDLMPLRKGLGQVPRKGYLNEIDKYGGYNKPTYTGFVLIKYTDKTKTETAFCPITLLDISKLQTLKDKEDYCNSLGYSNARVLLDGRIIKTNTLLDIDGYRVHIAGKSSGDLWFKGAQQLSLSHLQESYIKKIGNYYERTKGNKVLPEITTHDCFTKDDNLSLYDLLVSKMGNTSYITLMPTAYKTLIDGKALFENDLSIEEQVVALFHIIELFGCNSSQGKDLTLIGGAKSSGIQKMTLKLNKKRFATICIIDQSPTGLFEKKSPNLLEL